LAANAVIAMADVQISSVVDEVLDFLIGAPTPEQIVDFHASEAAQTRLRYLLDQNRSAGLTPQEKIELEEMSRVDHFVTLLKARALKMLQEGQANKPA
jgi:hypothetical protein